MDISEPEVIKKSRRRSSDSKKLWIKQEKNALLKKVSIILQKSEHERTDDEKQVLLGCTEVAQEVSKRLRRQQQLKSRQEEIEDPPGILSEKCRVLAMAISQAQHLVVYTGAGISTAACIPDYRGPNGVWTLLQQGKDVGSHDLSLAEPTLTHMALSRLYHMGRLKHVVSQNCDGLHLRSGLPRTALSEVHGNMYLEVCRSCSCEYLRLFDVTERTARYSHHTRRLCHACGGPLQDTIVHFGERGSLKWPLNWSATTSAARDADVLKKYPWLWCLDKPVKSRPLLYIVNLQWTPKDEQAALKINGRCDEVFLQVMQYLQIPIPRYGRSDDPIFSHSTPLHVSELRTTSRPSLQLVLETLDPSSPTESSTKCLSVDNVENMPCDEAVNSAIQIKSDEDCVVVNEVHDDDSPLDLTMKPRSSLFEESSLSYNTIGLDLSFPWFSMHYFLSRSVKQEHNYCIASTGSLNKGECQFCWRQYGALKCLFYSRKTLTECAIISESSDEEEDVAENAAGSSKMKSHNPGWFGKGYRKAKMKKKKTS
ncbi:hypothetical protein B566_EDAN016295 [Ephemera danica]|nr:hypothetical protein B566_EDAN016295 [Ephemera danica]